MLAIMLKCATFCAILLVLPVCVGCAGAPERTVGETITTGGANQVSGQGVGGAHGGGDLVDSGDASFVGSDRCTNGQAIPETAPSRQVVRFVLRNTGSQPRLVAKAGTYCTAFGVAERSGTGWRDLTVATGSNACNGRCELCNCDGGKAVPSQLVTLGPGDAYAFDWDARSYHSCDVPITQCPERTKLVGASQPIAPGPYRVSVPTAAAAPSNCTADDEAGQYTCAPTGFGGCNWSLPMCQLESSVSVEFSVPESGDIQVEVPIA